MSPALPFFLGSLLVPLAFSAQQAVTVKGIVNCRGHRQPGTFVQLYDEDSIFDSDDLLGSVIADHRGVFCVKGSTEEFTSIEPYIFIEHNCGYEGLNEKRVFSKMIPVEYVTEGEKAKHVYHMGDIELLTADAPVQKYDKRIYIETNIDERIRQCIPVYVQYKKFYEKTVFETKVHETVLPTDEDVTVVEEPIVEPTEGDADVIVTEEPTEEPVDNGHGQVQEHHEHYERTEEEKRVEEERIRLEDEQKKLDEIRRLEEEALRLEEIRRIEEEKRKIEEIRRQEEEQQKIELERREEERRLENERRAEEERKREEEAKLQEQRRKEQEDEHKRRMEEYHRREQERQETIKRREEEIRRREEEEKSKLVSSVEKVEKKDPCVQYPIITQSQSISRDIELRHEYVEDPCLRR